MFTYMSVSPRACTIVENTGRGMQILPCSLSTTPIVRLMFRYTAMANKDKPIIVMTAFCTVHPGMYIWPPGLNLILVVNRPHGHWRNIPHIGVSEPATYTMINLSTAKHTTNHILRKLVACVTMESIWHQTPAPYKSYPSVRSHCINRLMRNRLSATHLAMTKCSVGCNLRAVVINVNAATIFPNMPITALMGIKYTRKCAKLMSKCMICSISLFWVWNSTWLPLIQDTFLDWR